MFDNVKHLFLIFFLFAQILLIRVKICFSIILFLLPGLKIQISRPMRTELSSLYFP